MPDKIGNYNELLIDLGKHIDAASEIGKMVALVCVEATQNIQELLSIFINQNTALYQTDDNRFIFVINKVASPNEVAEFTHQLTQRINHISAGVAIYPLATQDIHDLIELAEHALISQSDDKFKFYRDDVHNLVKRRITLQSDIHNVVQHDQLELAYQPIIATSSLQVSSLESLLKWKHPTLGYISPEEFVPIAEDQDMMSVIGEWVLNRAMHDYQSWQRHDVTLSINISPMQLRNLHFVAQVETLVKKYNLKWNRLLLELTENNFLHDKSSCIKKLTELTSHGLSLTIDDYGTGYSSLEYLYALPISNIKLDKSYIQKIDHDKRVRCIVKATINLAHELGLSVTVEGVETANQQAQLKSLGADTMQGYYFSKPLPSEEVSHFIDSLKK